MFCAEINVLLNFMYYYRKIAVEFFLKNNAKI